MKETYIKSGPGTGKTHYIAESIKASSATKIIACTFTRKAGAQLRERIGRPLLHCGTIHSLALRIYASRFESVRMTTDEEQSEAKKKICSIAKTTVSQLERDIRTNSHSNAFLLYQDELANNYLIDPDMLIWEVQHHLNASCEYWGADKIYVDECQDLSAAELSFIRKLCPKEVVYVGDPHQAIYGWRHKESGTADYWETMISDESLTKSYRCARIVCEFCNLLFEGSEIMSAFDNQGDYRIASDVEQAMPVDAILCRYNRDVLRVRDQLGITTADNERERATAKRLAKWLWFYTNSETYHARRWYCLDVLKMTADEHIEWQAADGVLDIALPENTEEARFAAALNRACGETGAKQVDMMSVYADCHAETVAETCYNLERWNGAEQVGDGPQVMTVHKAKGLEWDRVCIYNSRGYSLSKLEDRRLLYVARSRARNEIVEIY